jgi:hypothetical protein
MNYKYRLTLVILIVAMLFSQSACSFKSLKMTKEEIQQPKDSEGIIFGSILVEAKEPENDSGWQTFWKGKKASDFKYKFLLSKSDGMIASHEIIVEPNTEKLFVAKLDSGDYSFFRIMVGSNYLRSDTDIRFNVKPHRATYIGKLIVSMPERVKWLGKFSLRIEDEQSTVIPTVRQEYEIDDKILAKELMYIKKE